ncbi:MAG: sulfate/molybdate ABC transporter ATP-binding protein, partial [Burkholderiaceae bacterium]
RKELRRWLRRLHDELHVTSVFVTHDQEEALEVADRVVVLNAGRIEQIGAPEEVYTRPANAFVYGFLGAANRFEGQAHSGSFHAPGLQHPVPEFEQADEVRAVAFARPFELEVDRYSPGDNGLAAQLVRRYARGANVLLELEREDSNELIEVEIPRGEADRLRLSLGETLIVRPRVLRVFGQPSATAA